MTDRDLRDFEDFIKRNGYVKQSKAEKIVDRLLYGVIGSVIGMLLMMLRNSF